MSRRFKERIRDALTKFLPAPVTDTLLKSYSRVKYFGFKRRCPVCGGNFRKFFRRGPDSLCLNCGSRERHRLVWKFFIDQTDLFEPIPKRMLHVAPEEAFSRILKKQSHLDYLTADLYDPNVMVKMDITDIQYPDNSFDVIYCSHVLEHVQDDRKAMRELARVLKPEGWAILQVPVADQDRTFEDPSITDPDERERLFWQHDHVRLYGRDYEDRLIEEGFDVRKYGAVEVVGAENIEKLKVWDDEDIYFCTKRTASSNGEEASPSINMHHSV